MRRVTDIIRRADRGNVVAADVITLDRQARSRRRIVMKTDGGAEFLLDLAELTYLGDGDALILDGEQIEVRAMLEPIMEIKAENQVALAKIAWHLGNRHTPAEITSDAIYVLPDHVLAAMVEGLGGAVRQVVRAFEPEGGAYGGHNPLFKSHHHSHGAHTHDHHHHHE